MDAPTRATLSREAAFRSGISSNFQNRHFLISDFHSACDCINVIASFDNADITSRLEPNGRDVCSANIEQYQCLSNSVEWTATSAPSGEIQEMLPLKFVRWIVRAGQEVSISRR
jgi:hypothetical protein